MLVFQCDYGLLTFFKKEKRYLAYLPMSIPMSVRRRLAYLFLKVKMLRMLRDNFFTFYNLIKKLRFLKGKQHEFYN